MKTALFVEFGGKQTEDKALVAQAKELWVAEGKKVKDIQTLNLYVKPEESAAYYVINDDFSGKIEL